MLLSLPLIAPEVPPVIEFSPAGERHLRLVLGMSSLGMISDADLSGLRRTRMSASAIRRLIEAGWQRAIGDDYEFKLISAFARLILPDQNSEEEFTSDNDEPLIGVAIHAARPEWIAIGQAFEAVEAEYPGLGVTALRILDSSLCRFGVPHTPSGAFDMAQNLYWQGEDDESIVFEEYDDVPRRADLFAGVPEWAYDTFKPEIVSVPNEDFPACVARLAERPVGKLLSALLRLKEVDVHEPGLFAPPHGEESWPNEPPVVTGWREVDDFNQVFDDNYRYFAEGGEEPPWIGCIKFIPNEAGIAEALPRIRHTGSVLRALDMALIAARDYKNEL